VADAEAWIAASPVERLQERSAAEGLPDEERKHWQQALAHEEAGAERLRGALNRAALAVAAGERLAEALQRIDALRTAAPPEPAEDTERALSAIDQDIVALDTRRTQIALGRDQRRETLARLEEQFRGQAETIEALRREREAAAGSSAASGGTDDPALGEAREAEAAAA